MILQQAKSKIAEQLLLIYNKREAAQIAFMVIEHITGFTITEQTIYKSQAITTNQMQQLQNISTQLLQHKPIQQIIGYTWFAGEKFLVNEHVLIPRPETDELVNWIVQEQKHKTNLSILDIGTGSGCIAISLAKQLKQASVWAIDVSEKALKLAKQNAEEILTKHVISTKEKSIVNGEISQARTLEMTPNIKFLQFDFLKLNNWQNLPKFDVIVSNPPYIKESEAAQMQANVLQYEPHEALFVPNNNALLFYEAIAQFAKTHLNTKGSIYVEINEALGKETQEVFIEAGFKTLIKKDLQGKDRMILIES